MAEQSGAGFIVVGVDGSDRSAHALRWALQHAKRTGAAVRAIMCWDEPNSIFLTPTHTEDFYQAKAEEVLGDVLAQTAHDAEGVDLQASVLGHVAGTALTQAAEGAELLVVGCHNRIDQHGVHLGSVASYCAHHAPCPVLIFREPAPQE